MPSKRKIDNIDNNKKKTLYPRDASASVRLAPRKCQHNRKKNECKECGGSSICPHQRIKNQCKECGGNSFCEHQRPLHQD